MMKKLSNFFYTERLIIKKNTNFVLLKVKSWWNWIRTYSFKVLIETEDLKSSMSSLFWRCCILNSEASSIIFSTESENFPWKTKTHLFKLSAIWNILYHNYYIILIFKRNCCLNFTVLLFPDCITDLISFDEYWTILKYCTLHMKIKIEQNILMCYIHI